MPTASVQRCSLSKEPGALADDLQAAAVIIVQDIEEAPQAIVDLGFAEAAVQWQQLAAEVAAMGDAGLGDQGFAPRSLGWRRAEVSDADDLYLRFEMQVAPDGGVGMGSTGASPVTAERLTGDQVGYFRIHFESTGKYPSAQGNSLSAGARLRASDWVDGDFQKWRPIRANQASLPVAGTTSVVTMFGWFLVQRASGLLVTAQPQPALTLTPAPGSIIPLLQTTADGRSGDKLDSPFSRVRSRVNRLEGEALITIAGVPLRAAAGDIVLMPANQAHSVAVPRRFKMLLTMIRSI